MSVSPDELTPQHVRAARALLAWSQQDLAKRAGVATSTIADFERGKRTPITHNAQAIRVALEEANISFLPTGAVVGPSIPKISASERPSMPIRWVDVEDLAMWANRQDSISSLPILLKDLIHANHGPSVKSHFPSDEGGRRPDWDGRTSAEHGSTYVPQGEAGWEITSQRSNINRKATDDYRKRTDQPAPLEPATSTYVFVTLRHWRKKDEWRDARRSEGAWGDVRVYDADDLVDWIEQTPAVGLRLARHLGKRPEGTRELEEIWEEWSLATQWPLTEDLILCDRDEDAALVLRWLREGKPSILSIQATTAEEVVAFFYATISMLPDYAAGHYRARCLIATNAASGRALVHAPPPLIVVLTEPEPGLARRLTGHGHFVLIAYDGRPVSDGVVRMLRRPSLEGIADALINIGISKPKAEALALDSARDLAVLRRLIPSVPGRIPAWRQQPPPHNLLVALLAGGWDEANEADRDKVSELAGEPYNQVTAALTPYIGDFDSPLRIVGSIWRMASPHDAWMLLAPYLTIADLERFEAVAFKILASVDPRFDIDPDDRWSATLNGIHPKYSERLRHGVAEVLILLALWGDKIQVAQDGQQRSDRIVSKLLQNADEHRWWSLSREFRLLAEASPRVFLEGIEDNLRHYDPPIRALLEADYDGIFGQDCLSELLWALELLAWSPKLLPRVTLVLARLNAIGNRTSDYSNGPSDSLRRIYLLWQPKTYASLEQRLQALDLIRNKQSDSAWKLMIGLVPNDHDISFPPPLPRWRNFSVDKREEVTSRLLAHSVDAISRRLLEDVGVNASRWQELLGHITDIAPDPSAVISALATAEPKIRNKANRSNVWKCIRFLLNEHRQINLHRQISNDELSISDEQLDELEKIYNKFAPTDLLERVVWLFELDEQNVELPNPSHEGWQARVRQVKDARRQAVVDVFSVHGIEGVLKLSLLAPNAKFIGTALFEVGLQDSDLGNLLQTAVLSSDARQRDLAHGLIVSAFRERREPWAAVLIAKAQAENWGDMALLTIFSALPERRWTWDQVAQAGEVIESTYWRDIPTFWMNKDDRSASFALRKLISVGRARHALKLSARYTDDQLPSELLVEVLREAARQSNDNDGEDNGSAMFRNHVADIFTELDTRSDIDVHTFAELELTYLLVLKDSRRPVRVLFNMLSEQPSRFVDVLSAVFRPSEDSEDNGVGDCEPHDSDQLGNIAEKGYWLLRCWNKIPGTREDGRVDGEVLEAWIKEARLLAKTVGREDVADDQIGALLSASPMGTDNVWPAEAVRNAIDLFQSEPMTTGFCRGKMNRRRFTVRRPRAGGDLERVEANEYRKWAAAIIYDYPHTAKALDKLAESYEHDARNRDEEANLLDL